MKKVFLLLFAVIFINCYAQKEEWSKGLSYGCGNDYTKQNYYHDNNYLRAHFYYTPKQKNNSFNWQLLIEPEVNFSRHIDKQIIKFNMMEYSITFGGIARQYFGGNDKCSIYLMMGSGPVFLDTYTSREPKGIAYINTLAIGTSYKIGRGFIELRPNLRHISNAGSGVPNLGIDTVNIEVGYFYPLSK